MQAHRKDWVEKGALFSYGADLGPVGRQAARYVDRILRGTPPADLAVEVVPDRRVRDQPQDRQQARIQGAADDDHPSRRGVPVAQPERRSPSRGHACTAASRLIWKYTAVVVTLVVAAVLSVGLTELYFSSQRQQTRS